MKWSWKVVERPSGFFIYDERSNVKTGFAIAEVSKHRGWTKNDKEAERSARLFSHIIAAAPDMIAALERVAHRCNYFETDEYKDDPMGKDVLDALKKARAGLREEI